MRLPKPIGYLELSEQWVIVGYEGAGRALAHKRPIGSVDTSQPPIAATAVLAETFEPNQWSDLDLEALRDLLPSPWRREGSIEAVDTRAKKVVRVIGVGLFDAFLLAAAYDILGRPSGLRAAPGKMKGGGHTLLFEAPSGEAVLVAGIWPPPPGPPEEWRIGFSTREGAA